MANEDLTTTYPKLPGQYGLIDATPANRRAMESGQFTIGAPARADITPEQIATEAAAGATEMAKKPAAAPAPAPGPQLPSAPPTLPTAIETYTFSPEVQAAEKILMQNMNILSETIKNGGDSRAISAARRNINNGIVGLSSNILGAISSQSAVGNVSGGALTTLYKQGFQRILQAQEKAANDAIQDMAKNQGIAIEQATAIYNALMGKESLSLNEFQRVRELGIDEDHWKVTAALNGTTILNNILGLAERYPEMANYLQTMLGSALQGTGIELPAQLHDVLSIPPLEQLLNDITSFENAGIVWEYGENDANGNATVRPKLDANGHYIMEGSDADLASRPTYGTYGTISEALGAGVGYIPIPVVMPTGEVRYKPGSIPMPEGWSPGIWYPEGSDVPGIKLTSDEGAEKFYSPDESGVMKEVTAAGAPVAPVIPGAGQTPAERTASLSADWTARDLGYNSNEILTALSSDDPVVRDAAATYAIDRAISEGSYATIDLIVQAGIRKTQSGWGAVYDQLSAGLTDNPQSLIGTNAQTGAGTPESPIGASFSDLITSTIGFSEEGENYYILPTETFNFTSVAPSLPGSDYTVRGEGVIVIGENGSRYVFSTIPKFAGQGMWGQEYAVVPIAEFQASHPGTIMPSI